MARLDRGGEAEMIYMWGGFLLFIFVVLAVDLGVLNRDDHEPSGKEALTFTAMTIVLALGFAGFVVAAYDNHWQGLGLVPDAIDGRTNDGHLAAVKFLTGYVVELSLSMDNVFVIALIFAHLRVPRRYQHRVLFWGILGALAMRGSMIAGGTALVIRYHWVTYLFGAFLILTSAKMLLTRTKDESPEERWIVKWLNRHFRVTGKFHEQRFTIIQDGRRWMTPLAVALVLVESTDLLFAVDSIPAIFAITTDPFLVFTSNVFAILCLRSLYFGLAGLIDKFRYLNISLAVILGLVGAKMLAAPAVERWLGESQNLVMLVTVVTILVIGGVVSAVADRARR
jgi:tellurite resistance protein TerC